MEIRKHKSTARRPDKAVCPVNNPVVYHPDQPNRTGAVRPKVCGLKVDGNKAAIVLTLCLFPNHRNSFIYPVVKLLIRNFYNLSAIFRHIPCILIQTPFANSLPN